MSEDVTVKLDNIAARVKALGNFSATRPMELLGQKALQLNEEQIHNQIDRFGRKFPPYSDRWKHEREMGFQKTVKDVIRKVGTGQYDIKTVTKYSKPQPRDPNVVDLVITGQMLQNLDVQRVTINSVTIGFSSPEEARKARGVYQNEHRPIKFVGLTPSNRSKLIQWFYTRFIKNSKTL
jgi:hypothetical protein